MLTSQFRLVAALGVSVFLLAVGSVGTWTVTSRTHAADAIDSKLKGLLKEKLAVAQQVATLANKTYQVGSGSFSEVVEANQAVGKAQLDLCDTNAERVVVLERMLTQARELHKNAAVRVEAAIAPESSLLKAKLNLLDAEIALERAKENQR